MKAITIATITPAINENRSAKPVARPHCPSTCCGAQSGIIVLKNALTGRYDNDAPSADIAIQIEIPVFESVTIRIPQLKLPYMSSTHLNPAENISH
jgi:hypothetical protein